MATTKRRSTGKTTARRTPRKSTSSTAPQSLMADTQRTIEARPKTSAAIAAGLITGIAAGVAGYIAWKRSGKSWEDFSNDVATSVKDSASNARTRIKDGIEEARTKAQSFVERRRDGIDPETTPETDDDKTQTMIAEEAMTLKATGKKTKRPVDDTIATELKTGAISY